MSYSKCGVCLRDLEVITPASGVRYVCCLDWRQCPFFCREDTIPGYHQCLLDHVIPGYNVKEGSKLPLCQHEDVPAMSASSSEKNRFTPYFACRSKNSCRYFQWTDEEPYYGFHQQGQTLRREPNQPSCKERDIDDN